MLLFVLLSLRDIYLRQCSRSASLEDYKSEKNYVILCRDESWSLKNNVGMIRKHYAIVLSRITKKPLLKHHTDGSNPLLNPELVASLGDPCRSFWFAALFRVATKLRIILRGTARGCF